jgi:aspartate aminotransferase
MATLRPEGAYRVLARAQALERQGRDIIHLEIGEPDFATDPRVCRAAADAVAAGRTRYNPTPGIRELREAIAEDAGRRRGIAVRPEQVVVGPGAKPFLVFPTLALVEPGDEVLLPDPGFPTYEAMIAVAGGIPVHVPLVEANGFSFDFDAFERLVGPRTRLIILNSPGNPTGGVMPQADLERVAAAARRFDCWVLSDEVYARLTYDGRPAPSIASIDGMAERTVIVDGFSKTYAMTGWRLGFGIMPEALAEQVNLLLMHAVGCTAHFTQFAGLEALRGPQDAVDRMVAAYRRRRDALVAGLNSIPGVRCGAPAGAFYAFPNVTAFRRPSAELADVLLDQAGVAVLPGAAFGARGEGYLRLCFANSPQNIERAVDRMRRTLAPMRA